MQLDVIYISRDVVFDEMSSWYAPTVMVGDADAGNGNAAINAEQQSQALSGPRESSTSGSNAWTGRLRSSESSHGCPDSVVQVSHKGKEKVDQLQCLMCLLVALMLMESQVALK